MSVIGALEERTRRVQDKSRKTQNRVVREDSAIQTVGCSFRNECVLSLTAPSAGLEKKWAFYSNVCPGTLAREIGQISTIPD